MAAAMKRGTNVALTREIPNLTGLVLGVDFQAGAERALADNLVGAVIMCDPSGKALSNEHFVFFNQLTSPDESVSELEQRLGEDEDQIEIDLTKVPAEVNRIVAVLYVNDGPAQRRTLGQLKECSLRVLDLADRRELVRSENLAPELTSETAIALGEIYLHNGDWKFKVIGQGYSKGIAGIAADYGITF
ncbi:MAG TPA: TerD family protein [Jatrophihabitans sp.]